MPLLATEGAEILVPCGDLTGPAVVEACSRWPAYDVFENNDFDENAGRLITVTHGDPAGTLRRLASAEPDYLL